VARRNLTDGRGIALAAAGNKKEKGTEESPNQISARRNASFFFARADKSFRCPR
jgi:hypothetical protein